ACVPVLSRAAQAGLIAEQRGDAFNRPELGPISIERAHETAVVQRLVHREVDAVTAGLEPCRIERTGAVPRLSSTARGALVCEPIDIFLEEEELDAAVRRRFERLVPAGRGTAVAACFLLPPCERGRLLRDVRSFQERHRELVELGRRRIPLPTPPPHHTPARLPPHH